MKLFFFALPSSSTYKHSEATIFAAVTANFASFLPSYAFPYSSAPPSVYRWKYKMTGEIDKVDEIQHHHIKVLIPG